MEEKDKDGEDNDGNKDKVKEDNDGGKDKDRKKDRDEENAKV